MWLYGLCSRIPFSLFHNLLCDFDELSKKEMEVVKVYLEAHDLKPDWWERTPNGYHSVKLGQFRFESAFSILENIPFIDKSWLQLGKTRGYWFLWTRNCFMVSKLVGSEVQFMKLNIPEGNVWLNMKLLTGSMMNLKEKKSVLRNITVV